MHCTQCSVMLVGEREGSEDCHYHFLQKEGAPVSQKNEGYIITVVDVFPIYLQRSRNGPRRIMIPSR